MYYGCYLSTKIKAKDLKQRKETGMIVIEPDDYTSAEVKAIKAKGYIVLAYLSVGTLEKEREWYPRFKRYRLKQLEDWHNEWYIDIRRVEWLNFLVSRAKALRKKGYDGLWCDNLDVYEYNKSKSMYTACIDTLIKLKNTGGYIMVNGGSELFDTAMDKGSEISVIVNGITQEEVYSRITSYSGKGKFGEQTSDMHKWYKEYMKRLRKKGVQTFLLEYTRDDALKERIKNFCKKYKMTGYYIASDVNL